MFNITDLQYATQEQFVNIAHSHVSIPALIILFVTVILALLIASAIVNDSKKEWANFWKVFGLTMLIVTVVFCLLIFLPQLTQKFVTLLNSIFIGA